MDNSTVDYIHRKFCTPDTLRCKTWFKRKQRLDRKKKIDDLGFESYNVVEGQFIDSNTDEYNVTKES
jgi:hypothetical protein